MATLPRLALSSEKTSSKLDTSALDIQEDAWVLLELKIFFILLDGLFTYIHFVSLFAINHILIALNRCSLCLLVDGNCNAHGIGDQTFKTNRYRMVFGLQKSNRMSKNCYWWTIGFDNDRLVNFTLLHTLSPLHTRHFNPLLTTMQHYDTTLMSLTTSCGMKEWNRDWLCTFDDLSIW